MRKFKVACYGIIINLSNFLGHVQEIFAEFFRGTLCEASAIDKKDGKYSQENNDVKKVYSWGDVTNKSLLKYKD